MLAHYFRAAIASFRRAPVATLVSVLTLALGLVCFVVAYGVVGFWARADRHFENAERTFVVTSSWRFRENGAVAGAAPQTNLWIAQYLLADFPQLDALARVSRLSTSLSTRAGDRTARLAAYAADPDFLRIFNLPFVAGDATQALSEPGSVVLTREAARRLYGRDDPIGESIALDNEWNGTVTGVIDRIPEPSHMGRSAAAPVRFDLLSSRDFLDAYLRRGGADPAQAAEDWIYVPPNITYLLLPADGSFSAESLSRQLPAFVARHMPKAQLDWLDLELGLLPVTDALGTVIDSSLLRGGASVRLILLLLGALVLGVACLDFTNLAAARAARRAREIGVRKAIGAKTAHVVAQCLVETGVLVGTALAAALVSLTWLMPVLVNVSGVDLRLSLLDATSLAPLLALLVVVTLGAGAYPALLLARLRPMSAMRVDRSRIGPRFVATLLVGCQFAVTTFLLIAVAIVYLQNRELERTGLGSEATPLLVIENDTALTNLAQETLHDALVGVSQVTAATAVSTPPWTEPEGLLPFASSSAAGAPERSALLHVVSYDYFETFGVQLLAGRQFDPERADDVAAYGEAPRGPQNIVISRALAEEMGYSSPAMAVGESIFLPVPEGPARVFQIIGVAESRPLNISSSRGPRPSVYLFNPRVRFHVVRLSSEDLASGLAAIDALWARLAPGVAPSRRFAEEYFNDAYANFVRVNQAFTALALIAVAISAIGLFGMATLIAGRRTAEIGVRKTLGGTTTRMALMLLASFSRPVLVANLVAFPFAYLAARQYLEVFIDPIALTPAPFAAALFATLAIACVAVLGQTLRAARRSPASVLRHD